jgi:hypothetical protein
MGMAAINPSSNSVAANSEINFVFIFFLPSPYSRLKLCGILDLSVPELSSICIFASGGILIEV